MVNFDSLNYAEMSEMSEKYESAGIKVKELFSEDQLEG